MVKKIYLLCISVILILDLTVLSFMFLNNKNEKVLPEKVEMVMSDENREFSISELENVVEILGCKAFDVGSGRIIYAWEMTNGDFFVWDDQGMCISETAPGLWNYIKSNNPNHETEILIISIISIVTIITIFVGYIIFKKKKKA